MERDAGSDECPNFDACYHIPGISDPRVPEVFARAYGYYPDRDHILQVARLGQVLFDQLKSIHGYGEDEATLLCFSSLLHDIGWMGGRKGHHRRSGELIRADHGIPLSPRERTICSLVARYHRKALPSLPHPVFPDLGMGERVLVCRLASLLRIADALDLSHRSLVSSIDIRFSSGGVCAGCTVRGPAPGEAAAVRKKRDLFEAAFHTRFHARFEAGAGYGGGEV